MNTNLVTDSLRVRFGTNSLLLGVGRIGKTNNNEIVESYGHPDTGLWSQPGHRKHNKTQMWEGRDPSTYMETDCS